MAAFQANKASHKMPTTGQFNDPVKLTFDLISHAYTRGVPQTNQTVPSLHSAVNTSYKVLQLTIALRT